MARMSYVRRKMLRRVHEDVNSSGFIAALRSKRKKSPRKLEPHEVVALLKARKPEARQ